MKNDKILLSHGSGGSLMHLLIKETFLRKLDNPILRELSDSAIINKQYAFTTDSFVVSPLIFPGADIGRLAVCGTVNDLTVSGAKPEYLALSMILEEGLSRNLLEKIVSSISRAAKESCVECVTGDVKVVEKGACDKMFITSCGLGKIINKRILSLKNIRPHDKIILTGSIGDHGLAVLSARKDLNLGFRVKSDCNPLNMLLVPVLEKDSSIKFMRDPTRGGIATTLNEIAQSTGLGILIEEKKISVDSGVRAGCEMLGIDPMYLACEGKALIVVDDKNADKTLALLKKHPLGRRASLVGEVVSKPAGRVVLKTIVGTERIIDMLSGEPLPRIC